MSEYVLALERAFGVRAIPASEIKKEATKRDGKAFHGRNRQRIQYRGLWYDSKREAAYAARLDMLLMAGRIAGWDRQVPFRMIHDGHVLYVYTADFLVRFTDGHTEVHDAKATWKDKRGRVRTHNDRWPLIKRMMKIFHGIEVKEV